MAAALKPDVAEMLRALHLMHESSETVELRCIRGRQIAAGYFDAGHWELAAREAARLNSAGFAIYQVANAIDPALHARYFNRIEERATTTTTDRDVVRRRWLLVDLDPLRPKDTSATDAQVDDARDLALCITNYLHGEWSWSPPLEAASGNGAHLMYRIDLPNDAAALALVERVLKALAAKFNTDAVKVDVSVGNAARIWKLAGSVACKGDDTPSRPHRLSRIVYVPEHFTDVLRRVDLENVAAELERECAGTVPARPPPAAVGGDTGTASGTRVAGGSDAVLARVLDGLAARGIDASDRADGNGSRRIELSCCPWNAEHDRGEASIFVQPSGALGFKCLHNSCAGNGWRQLRELVLGTVVPVRLNGRNDAPGAMLSSASAPLSMRRKAAGFDLLERQVHRIGDLFEQLRSRPAPESVHLLDALTDHITVAREICLEVERQ